MIAPDLYSEAIVVAENNYNDWLEQYGTPRHSGRYPWGSGKDPYQSASNFYFHVKELKKRGVKETDIAAEMNMNTSQLRAEYSKAYDRKRLYEVNQMQELRDKGWSYQAIGDRFGVGASSVRSKLDETKKARNFRTKNTADALAEAVKKQGPIDIGGGTEDILGVSETMKKHAVAMLEADGYHKYNIRTYQQGTGKQTTIQVLAPPDMSFADVAKNKTKIQTPGLYAEDYNGFDIRHIADPVRVKKDRIEIAYGDKGGAEKDGLIEIRPNVKDLSLGANHYAQVRIATEGDLYLKGMAVYSDDLPKGKDIRFNTNKKSGTPFEKVLKPMKTDETGALDKFNPFGATIKAQEHYDKTKANPKGKLGAINIVNEEGDWSTWSHTLPSQFLSKQPIGVVKTQLDKTKKKYQAQFDELNALTNPVVKNKMLMDFADKCDSAAVHLKAAAMPRQASHVLIPFKELKDTEVYAPNYKNGEKVALVRYPHAGRFEMPILTVNNKNPKCKKTLGNTHDAIGIAAKVAARLSGADFDGDSVTVIPIHNTGVRNAAPLAGLKNFDPGKYAIDDAHWYHNELKKDKKTGKTRSVKTPMVTDDQKQTLMGDVSNLITDMTIRGADSAELARAVRHSMVVIDCVKHQYDYKASYSENGISELKQKYQGKKNAGASTLISKAKSPKVVNDRIMKINPKTGDKEYIYTGKTYTYKVDPKTGKHIHARPGELGAITKESHSKSTKMAEARDAFSLSSGTPVEGAYADYANYIKGLGNRSRKEALASRAYKYSPSAARAYAPEVKSLEASLRLANVNRPKERKAQILAGDMYAQYVHNNPSADDDTKKKRKGQYLEAARNAVGAKSSNIVISDKQWEAIQAGAITKTRLAKIIANTDPDLLKELATPKQPITKSPTMIARAKAMDANGITMGDIASALGVSTSTVYTLLK